MLKEIAANANAGADKTPLQLWCVQSGPRRYMWYRIRSRGLQSIVSVNVEGASQTRDFGTQLQSPLIPRV